MDEAGLSGEKLLRGSNSNGAVLKEFKKMSCAALIRSTKTETPVEAAGSSCILQFSPQPAENMRPIPFSFSAAAPARARGVPSGLFVRGLDLSVKNGTFSSHLSGAQAV